MARSKRLSKVHSEAILGMLKSKDITTIEFALEFLNANERIINKDYKTELFERLNWVTEFIKAEKQQYLKDGKYVRNISKEDIQRLRPLFESVRVKNSIPYIESYTWY